MVTQITVNLPLEKTRQSLLRYFETRDDIKVRGSEPDFVQVRASSWRPPPWMNVKIGMFRDDDRTRLTFKFDLRVALVTIALAIVMAIAIMWATPGSVGVAIGFIIATLLWAPFFFALEISKTKRKFLDDIREVFGLPTERDAV